MGNICEIFLVGLYLDFHRGSFNLLSAVWSAHTRWQI